MRNILAQCIGVFGLICSLLSFQMKKRRQIMALQMTASLSFSAQLFLLGATAGGCVDLISFFRTLVFSQNGKKWASSPVWLGAFAAAMVAAGALTYQDAWDLLPIAGSVLSTVALWMKEEKKIRLVSLGVGPCWLVYNLVRGAWSGALNEVLAMASILVGMWRNDRAAEPEKHHPSETK